MFFILFTTTRNPIDKSGNTSNLYVFGNSIFLYVCILVNLELLTQFNTLNWISLSLTIISIVSGFLMFWVTTIFHGSATYGTFSILFTNPTFLSVVIISTVANIILALLLHRVRRVLILIY